ncbi:hypothetical protein AVEN_188102-1 [Araneus ventricosus]|uniref:Uncharacterized protein n=1 Tax=Araneus ventricosus TaxID=182803 RepID=A0A4Y2K940_ARAVE|nr:hypothetical protein AVEN_188102-1 [Araneus ventricosus]
MLLFRTLFHQSGSRSADGFVKSSEVVNRQLVALYLFVHISKVSTDTGIAVSDVESFKVCREWAMARDDHYFGPLPRRRSDLDFRQNVVNTSACFSIVPFCLPADGGLFL